MDNLSNLRCNFLSLSSYFFSCNFQSSFQILIFWIVRHIGKLFLSRFLRACNFGLNFDSKLPLPSPKHPPPLSQRLSQLIFAQFLQNGRQGAKN
jgi:hypothetical protein